MPDLQTLIADKIAGMSPADVRKWMLGQLDRYTREAHERTGAERDRCLEDIAHLSAAIAMIDWDRLKA